jgi:hypothetical protein
MEWLELYLILSDNYLFRFFFGELIKGKALIYLPFFRTVMETVNYRNPTEYSKLNSNRSPSYLNIKFIMN